MKLDNLDIEQLVKLRTKMILEKKSLTDINLAISQKEEEYINYLMEDTCATGGLGGSVTGGDVGSSGMGAVTSPQPSSLSGSTIGSAWSDNGGTIGSGDISNPFPPFGGKKVFQKEMGKGHGAMTGKKSRTKKLDLKSLRSSFSKKQDYTATPKDKVKRVMNFDDFQKLSLDKVTKVTEDIGINQRAFFSDEDKDNIVGLCPNCEAEITESDVYSGNFMCISCETEGPIYDLIDFDR